MGRILKASLGHVLPAAVLSEREEAARRQAGLAALEEEARARGREAGLREGREEARAEALELLTAARLRAEALLEGSADTALALARRMAERIVGRAIALDPDVLAEIAASALAASQPSPRPLLRVHPEELAPLEAARPALLARLAAGVDLRLVADASVGRHGCVVETELGRLDARLETQLAALERALAARPRAAG